MRWTKRICRIAGAEIGVHAMFVVFIAWVAIQNLTARAWPTDIAREVGGALAIITMVLLHEVGHAVAARVCGFRARKVTLFPIGGVVRLDRVPVSMKHELVIALAGPAVNAALAVVFSLAAIRVQAATLHGEVPPIAGQFLDRLAWVNLALALLNLLPAFPMDGGRILRAALAPKVGYSRATEIAAGAGEAIAIILGTIGLFVNPVLVFVALVVWIGAADEVVDVHRRSAIHEIPIRQAMRGAFERLAPGDTLGIAAERSVRGLQRDLPVIEGDRLVGVLAWTDLLCGLAGPGRDMLVGELMRRDVETADPSETLDRIYDRMRADASRAVPVVHDGKVVGMLARENLGDVLLAYGALPAQRARRAHDHDAPDLLPLEASSLAP